MVTRGFMVLLLVVALAAASGCARLGGVRVFEVADGDYSSLRGEEGEWEHACSTNTRASYSEFIDNYPNSRHVTLARKRIHRIKSLDKNWLRLKQGMSFNDVDELVGPLSGFGTDAIRKTADDSSAERTTIVPFGVELPYSDPFCDLVFDSGGDLLRWERK